VTSLKIVCISDSHERPPKPEDMPEGDLLIHGGDFTMVGSVFAVIEFNQWLAKVKPKYKYGIVVIAGNHDKTFETAPGLVEPILTNCIYLNDSGIEINGFKIWGSPVTLAWGRGWVFNRYPGKDIGKHRDAIPDDTDVIISHGPPYGFGDRIDETHWQVKFDENGDSSIGSGPIVFTRHAGCKKLAARIRKVKPKLVVCGHIHEGYGAFKMGNTHVINASLLDECYSSVNAPFIITINKD
jgi:Icc-related predicted phosphoesterase